MTFASNVAVCRRTAVLTRSASVASPKSVILFFPNVLATLTSTPSTTPVCVSAVLTPAPSVHAPKALATSRRV
jgi:hypothetical protein